MTVEQIRKEIINLHRFNDLSKIEDTIKTAKNRFFRVGTKVSFKAKRLSTRVYGTIDKVNPKTIGVKTEDDGNWKVSKSLLKVEA